ncbi:unnamed protein product [Durusdinium trenchii]|uniref:CSD domain-containing protein n=2 Tax=Durusdinium trenchii TaxID=1381693 RepID=A0ABP0N296_9DINO
MRVACRAVPKGWLSWGRRYLSRQRGVMVQWDNERGFGKVQSTDGRELFVHKSYLREAVTKGAAVDFEISWVESKQQDHAKDVQLLKPGTGSTPEAIETEGDSAFAVESALEPPDLPSLPEHATDRQHLEMLTQQMDQLRKRGHDTQKLLVQNQQLLVQSQQLLVQGLFALIQQQNVQNANLERALKALTAQMGGEVSDLPEVKVPSPLASLEVPGIALAAAPEADKSIKKGMAEIRYGTAVEQKEPEKKPEKQEAASAESAKVASETKAPDKKVEKQEAAAAESAEEASEPEEPEKNATPEPVEAAEGRAEVVEAEAHQTTPTPEAMEEEMESSKVVPASCACLDSEHAPSGASRVRRRPTPLDLPSLRPSPRKATPNRVQLPDLTTPSPRGANGETLMPTLTAQELEKVRQVEDAPHSKSMPVSSFRNGKRVRKVEELDMLTMRDLAMHYRRCTTLQLESSVSDASSPAARSGSRSDTKSTRASETSPAPVETPRKDSVALEVFAKIPSLGSRRASRASRESDFDTLLPSVVLPSMVGPMDF